MWWHKYVGIPFVEKGRDASGLDCWGLVQLVYKQELSIELPSYLDVYETTNDRDALAAMISSESEQKWQDVADLPKPFDIVILNMRGVPMHVGIITKPNHMIHCAHGIGTAHEHLGTSRWKHKVVNTVRWGT